MRAISCLIILLFTIASCKKKADDTSSSPGDFYIKFKIDDSVYNYKTGANYMYILDMTTTTFPSYQFAPRVYITPLPANWNVYTIGLSFGFLPNCPACPPDMTAYGEQLFITGQKQICYTGVNWNALPYDLTCPGTDGAAIFWTAPNNKLLNSAAAVQPPGSFLSIDTVINFKYTHPTSSSLSFDKIIAGRFQCRVFDPQNNAFQKDLINGEYRMPIWKNKL